MTLVTEKKRLMWTSVLLVLIGAGVGVAFFAWAAFVASRRLHIEQRGDSLVVVNNGAEVHAAQISVTIAGQSLRGTKGVLPRGETILTAEDFVQPCPPLGGAAFGGGSVTGSRSVIGIGVGWTWYSSGPLTVTAEAAADSDPP